MSSKVLTDHEHAIHSIDEWADYIDAGLVRLKSWVDQRKGTALLVGDKVDLILSDVVLFKQLLIKFRSEKTEVTAKSIENLLGSLSVSAYRRSGLECISLFIQLHYLVIQLRQN